MKFISYLHEDPPFHPLAVTLEIDLSDLTEFARSHTIAAIKQQLPLLLNKVIEVDPSRINVTCPCPKCKGMGSHEARDATTGQSFSSTCEECNGTGEDDGHIGAWTWRADD